MPEYKDVSGSNPLEALRPGYHYYKNGDDENWYLDGKLHREDGPASIHTLYATDLTVEGLNNLAGNLGEEKSIKVGDILTIDQWYLHGVVVDPNELKSVLEGPIENLPLYLNTPYEYIVKRRLGGSDDK
jgi:hypothetical protein